jgi:hypothetical protein
LFGGVWCYNKALDILMPSPAMTEPVTANEALALKTRKRKWEAGNRCGGGAVNKSCSAPYSFINYGIRVFTCRQAITGDADSHAGSGARTGLILHSAFSV